MALSEDAYQLDARRFAELIGHGESDVFPADNPAPFELALDYCSLCLGPLADEEQPYGFWVDDVCYFAHIICVALAKSQGLTLTRIRDGQRESNDLIWAHRMGKCAPDWCPVCRNDVA